MNMRIQNILRHCLAMGVFCGAGLAAQASTLVTFEIEMSAQNPTSVAVRGSFNDWGNSQPMWALTNNGLGVWSGTFEDTNAPGTVESCKFFYQPGDNWEADPNRQFILASGTQSLPLTMWNVKDWPVPVNNVKFQLDMTAQVVLGTFDPNTGYVRVSGGFNNWSGSLDFTNDLAATGSATNIFSQTLEISGFPGSQPGNYKFRSPIGDTWETIPDRPSFTLVGGDQVLPVVYWNNQAPATPTNGLVVFQVDMTPQVLTGGFINGTDEVRVSGAFNGWGNGDLLTNDAAILNNGSNVYSTTLSITDFPNTAFRYKFRARGGWESAAIHGVGGNLDREFTMVGGDQVLPLVTYNDASLCDLLLQDTTVTFRLHLTNGTTGIDGSVFNSATDSIYINGEILPGGWQGWNVFLPVLTNNPIGSDFYEYTQVIPAGTTRAAKFKFGIVNGADNEAPQFADHTQYIRSTGPTYTMPPAEFGTNYAATRVEAAFGSLVAGPSGGGNVMISWLGGPCVTLQSRTNLTTGAWVDHPATDGGASTNWSNTGGLRVFRLQKRPQP
jgi:hypothetical protein